MKLFVSPAAAASLLIGVPTLALAAAQHPASHASNKENPTSHISQNKAKEAGKDAKDKDPKNKSGHKAKTSDKKNKKDDKSHDSNHPKKN